MINTKTSPQITRIYLVTNCYGDPNKVYIGKTTRCRKNKHIKTFGKDITYDYIDEVNSLNKLIWVPIECFWINYFKFLGFDVQNKNEGGGGLIIISEETRIKMSKPRSEEAKVRMRKPRSEEAKLNMRGPKSEETKLKISISNKGNPKSKEHSCKIGISNSKPVGQYSKDYILIKEWSSMTEVVKKLKLNIVCISNCCNGKQKSTRGYIFKLIND